MHSLHYKYFFPISCFVSEYGSASITSVDDLTMSPFFAGEIVNQKQI